ncbi:MAG: hypothetical protein HYV96_04260 [Opitutae bacterium]|nr:hypothetical protein [Opitutae bacterium]
MNTRTVSLFALGAAALFGVGASARAADAPSSTAPVTPPATIVSEAQPRPDRIVYSGQLPSVAQLTQTAQAQGLTIANITQTAGEIAVTYRLPDSSTRTVSYQLLPTNADGTAAVEPAPATVVATPASEPVQVVEVTEPPPTVVYRYRYYDPYYYDPFYWGPAPVSVHLGFGFGGHYRSGGGHYHHHHGRW